MTLSGRWRPPDGLFDHLVSAGEEHGREWSRRPACPIRNVGTWIIGHGCR